ISAPTRLPWPSKSWAMTSVRSLASLVRVYTTTERSAPSAEALAASDWWKPVGGALTANPPLSSAGAVRSSRVSTANRARRAGRSDFRGWPREKKRCNGRMIDSLAAGQRQGFGGRGGPRQKRDHHPPNPAGLAEQLGRPNRPTSPPQMGPDSRSCDTFLWGA